MNKDGKSVREIKQAVYALLHRSQDATPQERERIESELGEILLYIVRTANRLGINLTAAAEKRLEETISRAPTLVKPMPKAEDP